MHLRDVLTAEELAHVTTSNNWAGARIILPQVSRCHRSRNYRRQKAASSNAGIGSDLAERLRRVFQHRYLNLPSLRR